MKNLLVYLNPMRKFANGDWGDETNILVKVQIDNGLALGWRREDILLVTNFGYEYSGVRSFVVGDDVCCSFSPTANKINAIVDLFERRIIGDDLYWYHDFDAFQLEEITERELGLNGADMGITDYGRSSINAGRDLRWSTGTIFFKKNAGDIFSLWKREMYKYKVNEEIALLEMLKKGKYSHIKQRIRKLNITYNLATRKRKVIETYEMADKPLKVIHFHPFDKRPVEGDNDNMAVCVHGKNRMNKPLVTERLAEIFNHHGIE